ncbi:MAG: Crp/Fnr family transcriptional regulator [Rhodoferax sp.]|nr:Crp/Fnr family transcriptional regulator [Rhodoferax sp.]
MDDLPPHSALAQGQRLARGAVLFRRAQPADSVAYLESGRVALGLMDGQGMEHQLGVLQGPCWLDASSAVLGLPPAVDAVAESEVQLNHVPLADFRKALAALPPPAGAVLQDVARAHRQQTELAVSRLAKDAEARCAEWLLQHAQAGERGQMSVQWQQRKRAVAAQLGIAPETLSRVLRHLRERSLISGSGRTLSLIDPGRLRSLAGI